MRGAGVFRRQMWCGCGLARPGGLAAALWLGAAALTLPRAAMAQDTMTLPEIRVIAPTPLSTVSRPRRVAPASATRTAEPTPATPATPSDPAVIDRDKVPSNTESLT